MRPKLSKDNQNGNENDQQTRNALLFVDWFTARRSILSFLFVIRANISMGINVLMRCYTNWFLRFLNKWASFIEIKEEKKTRSKPATE